MVIELKTGDFEPEYAGKLNFYLKAVDEQLRHEGDQPSIGLLLCKSKDRLVAEYAVSDIHKPMGIASYELTHALPEALRDKLPSVERLETRTGSGRAGGRREGWGMSSEWPILPLEDCLDALIDYRGKTPEKTNLASHW